MKRFTFFDAIVFLIAVLFIYAAASKLIDFELFKAQIGKSPLITQFAEPIAWFIPGVEIVVSLALLTPRFQLVGLFASYFLMFMFTAYIGFILTFSPYVPCSCGGILNNMGWTEHLIFNIGFTLMSVLGIILYNRQRQREISSHPVPVN